jgi:hypothetical protein
MLFRFRYTKLGGHVHVTLFTGQSANHTLANSGVLCLYEHELAQLQDMLASAPKILYGQEVEFIEDTHQRLVDEQ